MAKRAAGSVCAGWQHRPRVQPEGFHFWLPLPKGSHVAEFAAYLRTNGVGVVGSAAFSTDNNPPDAVHVCLGGPLDRDQCEQALRLIAHTLEHPTRTHGPAL